MPSGTEPTPEPHGADRPGHGRGRRAGGGRRDVPGGDTGTAGAAAARRRDGGGGARPPITGRADRGSPAGIGGGTRAPASARSTGMAGRAAPGRPGETDPIAFVERDMWAAAGDYESFMGEWSRRVAERFLDDLHVPAGARWLDVGCGVGTLTATILRRSAPRSVVGVDPSTAFLAKARADLALPSLRPAADSGEEASAGRGEGGARPQTHGPAAATRLLPGLLPTASTRSVGATLEEAVPSAVRQPVPPTPNRTAPHSLDPAGPDVRLVLGRAQQLPFAEATFDVVVSGLVLNFLPDPARGLAEMLRVARPGGTVATYVWDYDHPDFPLTRFWAAAETGAAASGSRQPRARRAEPSRPPRGRRGQAPEVKPGRSSARSQDRAPGDERGRWAVCSPAGLAALAAHSRLREPRVHTITVTRRYGSAGSLWEGFLLGVGPSGAWASGLSPTERERVRERFLSGLPVAPDGSVILTARALVLAATAPGVPVRSA